MTRNSRSPWPRAAPHLLVLHRARHASARSPSRPASRTAAAASPSRSSPTTTRRRPARQGRAACSSSWNAGRASTTRPSSARSSRPGASWGLPPGEYLLRFPARLDEAGNAVRLDEEPRLVKVQAGEVTEVDTVLEHVDKGLIVAGVIAAVALAVFLDAHDLPRATAAADAAAARTFSTRSSGSRSTPRRRRSTARPAAGCPPARGARRW